MGQVVGPFEVMDATPAELARVAAVVSRIPPPMIARVGAGRIRLYAHNRLGAPSWAWGYAPRPRAQWWNPRLQPSQQTYAIAHEYKHGFDYLVRDRTLRARERALVVGTIGRYQGRDGTNRLSEATADGFARAIGFTDGPQASYFRARIPAGSYGALMAALGGPSIGSGAGSGYVPPPPAAGATVRLATSAPTGGWCVFLGKPAGSRITDQDVQRIAQHVRSAIDAGAGAQATNPLWVAIVNNVTLAIVARLQEWRDQGVTCDRIPNNLADDPKIGAAVPDQPLEAVGSLIDWSGLGGVLDDFGAGLADMLVKLAILAGILVLLVMAIRRVLR